MQILSVLQSLANWGPFVFLRDSKYGMPTIQSFHLMGLTIFLATTVAINLRLTGVGIRKLSLGLLARQLKPWAMGALAVLITSGILIFFVNPTKYLASYAFRIKMALLASALLFHFVVLAKATRSKPGSSKRPVNFIIAAISLTLWFGVGWAGRAIAFFP